MIDQLENLVGALVIIREYAGKGTPLRDLIEDSFQCPIDDIEGELIGGIECLVEDE